MTIVRQSRNVEDGGGWHLWVRIVIAREPKDKVRIYSFSRWNDVGVRGTIVIRGSVVVWIETGSCNVEKWWEIESCVSLSWG